MRSAMREFCSTNSTLTFSSRLIRHDRAGDVLDKLRRHPQRRLIEQQQARFGH